MERLSTLDAGFYYVEHDHVPMHFGMVAVFDGPAPGYQELADLHLAKLPSLPRYLQVVQDTPMHLLRPVWRDDDHFELAHHLRQETARAPGGAAELREVAARVFAQPLDRARPLWEAWLIGGLADGAWAMLWKVHHCLVDGVGGSDLITEILCAGLDDDQTERTWTGTVQQARLTLRDLADAVSWPVRQVIELPGLVKGRLGRPVDLLDYGRGLARSAGRLTARSASCLNGPAGPRRRWETVTVGTDQVKQIRHEHGGTVNDVLLAAVTSGFRALLAARDELADGIVVRSLVPVSVRADTERGYLTNRISATLVNLPVGEPDPLRRLDLLRSQTADLKQTRQAAGPEVVTKLLGVLPPALLALGTRAGFGSAQPLIQTVTTNVPGPPFPLFLLGRRMAAAYPYVPIGGNVQVGVAMFSYRDQLTLGLTADYDAVPDLAVLADGIECGVRELAPVG